MNSRELAIGVFDSGMGGLTVLRALRQRLPAESFIYLGDTARLPYGTKSRETVKQYAIQMAKILVEKQIKALVIACNTATTAALPYLQEMLPAIPVIGVVAPGALAVAAATKNQHIAVLATETTIISKAYETHILHHLPNAIVTNKACSILVALAEEGMVDNAIAREALKYYLEGLNKEDVILLGCTHFPVFKPLLIQMLPATTVIVDSALATASLLYTVLQAQQLFQKPHSAAAQTHYLVTDSIARFQRVGQIFLGEPLAAESIELIDA